MKYPTRIWIIAMVVLLAGVSCKFLANRTGQETAEPEPTYENRTDLTFAPDRLPDAQKGKEYDMLIKVENTRTPVGEFSVAEINLPPGLKLEKTPDEENTAHLVGTPLKTGTYSFTISVWCYGTNRPGQTGEKDYTLVVK